MVDISKIRVGDRITVCVTVMDVFRDDPQRPVLISDWPRPDQIVGHTPAPRPIVVGSRVRYESRLSIWTVLAIDRDRAWLKRPSEDISGYVYTQEFLDSLVLADEEPS